MKVHFYPVKKIKNKNNDKKKSVNGQNRLFLTSTAALLLRGGNDFWNNLPIINTKHFKN